MGSGSILTSIALLGACVRQLPPAAPPAPVRPSIQAPPPAAGTSRLVVDVVEGPTQVQRIQMQARQMPQDKGQAGFRFDEVPSPLCPISPCVADVPPGINVLLGFPVIGKDSLEVELVHVGPDPSVYRRSLSIYTDDTGAERTLGIIGTSLGAASAITGIALLPVGLAKGNDGLATAGAITLGVGALMVTLGILAIRHDAPTWRAGASSHFPL